MLAELLNRGMKGEAMVPGQRLELVEVPGGIPPGVNCPLSYGEFLIRDNQLRIYLQLNS